MESPKESDLETGNDGHFEKDDFDSDNQVDRVPTVALYDGDRVNLIPMPTDDPNGT